MKKKKIALKRRMESYQISAKMSADFNMEKFIGSYKDFIDSKKTNLEEEP